MLQLNFVMPVTSPLQRFTSSLRTLNPLTVATVKSEPLPLVQYIPTQKRWPFWTAAASLWLPRANIVTRRRLCRRTALGKTYMFEAFISTENSSALCQVEWNLYYLLQVSATSKQQLSTRVHLGVAVSIRWINYTTNAGLIVREFYRNLLKWW